MRLSSCNTEQLTPVATEVRALILQPEPKDAQHSPKGPARSYSFVSGIEASEIVRLYATGMSALAVAEKVGRPPRTVTDTLRNQGVEIRRSAPACEDLVAEMVVLYEAGLSCAKIARTLGIGRSTVAKKLKIAGVSARSKSQAAILRNLVP